MAAREVTAADSRAQSLLLLPHYSRRSTRSRSPRLLTHDHFCLRSRVLQTCSSRFRHFHQRHLHNGAFRSVTCLDPESLAPRRASLLSISRSLCVASARSSWQISLGTSWTTRSCSPQVLRWATARACGSMIWQVKEHHMDLSSMVCSRMDGLESG